MKILITADIHFPQLTSQQHNKFKYANTTENNFHVNRLLKLAEALSYQSPDEVWILGDLLDSTNINLCTVEVLKLFILKIGVPVKYLNGNHERINQNEYLLDYLNIGMTPLPKTFKINNTTFTSLNHNQIHEAPALSSDILLSHFRWSLPVLWGAKGELSTKSLSKIVDNYSDCILGDIHAEYEPEDNITYVNQPFSHKYFPSSPKGYVELNINEEGYAIIRHHLNLPNKIKISSAVEDIEKTVIGLPSSDLYRIDVVLEDELIELPQLPSNAHYRVRITDKDITAHIGKSKGDIMETFIELIPISDREYIKGILHD